MYCNVSKSIENDTVQIKYNPDMILYIFKKITETEKPSDRQLPKTYWYIINQQINKITENTTMHGSTLIIYIICTNYNIHWSN